MEKIRLQLPVKVAAIFFNEPQPRHKRLIIETID